MEKEIYIHALSDPRTSKVRYVGKSHDANHRLRVHLSDSQADYKGKSRRFALHNWLRQLEILELIPDVSILETVAEVEWPHAEQRWIKHFRELNGNKFMLNMTDGGDCGPVRTGSSHGNALLNNEDVIRIRTEKAGGKPATMLASQFGVSESQIFRVCSGATYKNVGGPTESKKIVSILTPTLARAVRERYSKQPVSQEQVAREFKTCQKLVSKICRGLVFPDAGGPDYKSITKENWRNGSRNWVAKLSEADVLEIRRLYSQVALTQTEIAQRFGIRQATVSAILLRKSWTHI